ncbi:phospholipase A1-like [Condylostylus longicornis]|uniref:phospholipase A1-like n=1 Tax=Condylostylus longicornis TaxID=2530218 RepID=UPI00244DA656|nr:phospholipase A1-like [Condylostylus longicornis]
MYGIHQVTKEPWIKFWIDCEKLCYYDVKREGKSENDIINVNKALILTIGQIQNKDQNKSIPIEISKMRFYDYSRMPNSTMCEYIGKPLDIEDFDYYDESFPTTIENFITSSTPAPTHTQTHNNHILIAISFVGFVWRLLIFGIGWSHSLPLQQNLSLYNDDQDSFWDKIDLEELNLSCKPLCDPANGDVDVKFYLYTRKNPSVEEKQELKSSDSETIKNSNFNYRKPTRFIIHGWNNNYGSSVNRVITEAYLHKDDYNVIVLDWSSCSKTINYFAARCCVDNVGKQLAKLIDILNEKHKLKFQQIKLIGHSLGAHVAGFAGKNIKRGKLPSIIGLDPALPCFKVDAIDERLSAGDAEYVETIHTNAGILGFFNPIGIASFYPNGGTKQPGCLKISCSHSRSFQYYAESVERVNEFIPKKCNNMEEIKKNNCNINADDIRMGGKTNNDKADGIFILPTNKAYPYAIGEH